MAELGLLIAVFVSLMFIYWLANHAEKARLEGRDYSRLTAFSYALIIGLYVLTFLGGIVFQFFASLAQVEPELLSGVEGSPEDMSVILEQIASVPLLAIGIWLPALVGLLLLIPAVRRLVARFTNLDPRSPVHAISLSLSMLILINLATTLGFGLENITETLEQAQALSGETPSLLVPLWTQQLLTALLAIIGVGWLSRLNWSKTMERLGIVRPTIAQVGLGIVLGVALIPAVIGLEYLTSLLGFTANEEVEALTELLLGGLFETPIGIITLGAAAALGEETIFRGAAQPRFGLFFTTALFALVHSTYGLTFSTLIVFLLGLVLGWIRIRHNTTTAMIVHAVYNSSLGLLSYVGTNFFEF